MKLSTKLLLAFAAGVALLLASALYGMPSPNRAIDTYRTTVQAGTADEQVVMQVLVDFKVQMQERKNTPLRAKDPARLSAYWSAFEEQEGKVAKAKVLQAPLPPDENLELLKKFAAAHAATGQGYRKGLEAFKTRGFDPTVGDKAVAAQSLQAQAGNLVQAVSLFRLAPRHGGPAVALA